MKRLQVLETAKASNLIDKEGNYMENKVKRELPDDLMKKMNLKPFETTEIGHPEVKRVAPKVRVTTGQNKIIDSLDEVIKNNLKVGMTISFHHHLEMGIMFLTW